MIVRDEAAVIARCLASVRHVVDCFVIVDTGSTDETVAIAWSALAGLPGMVVSRPWVDFGHNRSEALALARSQATYSLTIDASDEVLLADEWSRPVLRADSYLVEVQDESKLERAAHLVSNALPWRYVGVLHEFLSCAEAREVGTLPLVLQRHRDGRRHRDATASRDDAAILKRALSSETDPYLAARYAFYLAQNHRDAGDREAAIDAYLYRATLGGWEQEVFVSLYQSARLMEALGRDVDVVLATYRRASEACPTRAEAAHGASRLCRFKGRNAEGYALAKPAIHLSMPTNGLAVEPWIYEHGLLDEFAVNAYWSEHYQDCLTACRTLLALDDLSDDDRARFAANEKFAEDRITEGLAQLPRPPVAPTRIETLVDELKRRLGTVVDAVNLCVNAFDEAAIDARPLTLWMQDDIDRPSVQWLSARDLVAMVDQFVFVSAWQMARFVEHFGLRTDRCLVLRAATDVPAFDRQWTGRFPLRVACLDGGSDGIAILLEALDELGPLGVEVHIWPSDASDDAEAIRALRERAHALANVEFHADRLSRDKRRDILRNCDLLVCPAPCADMACHAVIEAMANGCRVVGAADGALPELVGPYGRTYPLPERRDAHVSRLAAILLAEVRKPWQGDPSLAIEQQHAVRKDHDWPKRSAEWRILLDRLARDHQPPIVGAAPRDRSRTTETLVRLHDRGFLPDGIIDAGARDGAFAGAARRVFPAAHVLMIDASVVRQAELTILSEELGDASSVCAVLGARNKTTRRMFRRAGHDPKAPQRTLSRLISELGRSFQMLKLDVGGGELDVLAGFGSQLAKIEVILMGMSLIAEKPGMPLFDVAVARLDTLGFVLSDFVDEHRFREGSLLRVEGLFVRPLSRLRLRP